MSDKQPEQEKQPEIRATVVLEFGDVHNRTITLNTLKLRVRGSFSIRSLAARPEGMRDVGTAMARMPEIPGQRIALDLRRKRYRIFDPLSKNKDLLDQINAVVKASPALVRGADYKACDTIDGELNDDQWKTLIGELMRKEKSNSVSVLEGKLPTEAEFEKMPGRRLNDPWNSSPRKPKYHDEMEEYQTAIDSRF